MKRSMLYAIFTVEELNVEKLNSLDMGVEIQDFVEPNLSKEEKDILTNKYSQELQGLRNIKAMHGPFLDLKPASPDKLIREVSYDRYLSTLEIGKKLKIDYLIFHSQINPYLNEPFIRDLNNRQNRDFWLKVLHEAGGYDGIILLENIFEETPFMLKELVETINLPNIKVNLDIGHAKLGKVGLETWIRELKDYIYYIHIHSNDGKYDKHERPSKKEIEELYTLLDKYNINPVLSLEYKTDNLEEEIKRFR